MADNDNPVYGIPGRFSTPEEYHKHRMATFEPQPGEISTKNDSWIPGADVLKTLNYSAASSFFGALAGDTATLDYVFDADITKDATHSLKNISDTINNWKPSGAHHAQQKKFVEDDGSLGSAWGDIYAYADVAGSGVGSIGALILGGGVLKIAAKGAVKGVAHKAIKKHTDDILKANKDISREAAEQQARKNIDEMVKRYDGLIGAGAYGTAEMAIVSGSVGMSIEEEVMRAPAEVINTSPRFREIYFDLKDNNEALSHDEAHNLARIKIAREAAIEGAKTVAIPSLLLGTVAGRYIDKAITGRLTKSRLANFGILTATEVPTEMAQGGTEQYVQNRVYKEVIDKTRNVWEGVPDSAVREGLGVAFGVAPLSMIRANAEAKAAERGGAPSVADLEENEELSLIDMAAQINEAATEDVLARTADDPAARFAQLNEIIDTGRVSAPTPEQAVEAEEDIDLDLDLNEDALAEIEAEDEAAAETPEEEAPPVAEEPVAEPEPEQPVGEVEPPAPPVTEPEGETVEPVEEPAPEPAEEPAPEPVEEEGKPPHKANFQEFRTGKASGIYTPEPARAPVAAQALHIGTAQDSVDLDAPAALERSEANQIGKILGIKTVTSRDNLNDRLRQAAEFTNKTTFETGDIDAINQIMKRPINTRDMTNDQKRSAAADLREQMVESANEYYDRQQHREAIEDAVAAGEFTLEDFNKLPDEDQAAYADIGESLRSGDASGAPESGAEGESEAPTGEPEAPEGESGTGEPSGDDEGPAEEETGEGEQDGPEGEETAAEPEDEGAGAETPEGPAAGEVEPPTGTGEAPAGDGSAEPVAEEEGPTPEEIEAQEAAEAERTANREAIDELLPTLQVDGKVIVYGTTISTGKEMNPETLVYLGTANNRHKFKKGKLIKFLTLDDGDYYIQSLSGKKSRLVTSIERKKAAVKDEDGNTGGTLRRPHEIWGSEPRNLDDAETALKQISAAVSHANYVNGVNYTGKTHGVKRLYQDILADVPPFLKWLAPHIGSEHGGTSPKEAVLAILRNQPLTQYNEQRYLNVQTPEELMALVDQYVEMMGKMQEIVQRSNNIRELRDNYARNEFEQEVPEEIIGAKIEDVLALDDAEYEAAYREYARTYRSTERAEMGRKIVPVNKAGATPEGSESDALAATYPSIWPKMAYQSLYQNYKSQKNHENISDNNLKQEVPRERQKLSVLASARAGMPDHRKGKNVSSQDLMDTFGFYGVTYGKWVSDMALEGELSEQQQYRNLVYDAFADLAYLTGLPPKAMGNDLYLSLGALGHGKNTGAAFFSPSYPKIDVTDAETEENIRDLKVILDNNDVSYKEGETAKSLLKKVEKVVKFSDADIERVRIIQFTRDHGDGSFAHEWAHNYGQKLKAVESGVAETLQEKVSIFGLHRYIKRAINKYIKLNPEENRYYDEEQLLQNLRDDLESTLTYSSDFTRPTDYYKNAKFLDNETGGHGGKKYWSTKWEMFARATEAYILDAIAAEGDGANNPFLQGHKAADGAMGKENGYPGAAYPEAEERQYFNSVLKQMFEDTKADAEGSIEYPVPEDATALKFGAHAEFERVKADYLANLDDMIEQAREDRILALEEGFEDEEENIFEGMGDDDIDDLMDVLREGQEDEFKEREKKEGGSKKPGKKGKTVTGGGAGAGLGGAKLPPKKAGNVIDDLEGSGFKIADEDKGFIEEIFGGPMSADDTRFSLTIDDYSDTRFHVDDIESRNPDLDPELYSKWVRFLSRMFAQFRDAGNRSPKDFVRQIKEKFGPEKADEVGPYLLQFIRDVRDGKINYREYVDPSPAGPDATGEGTDDGADAEGGDDGGGVQQPADEQADPDDQSGAPTDGTAGASPSGEGGSGSTGVDNAGDNEITDESPEELSQRIQKETGLRSPSVEPLPANLGVGKAQVMKEPIAARREYENDYQVPTSMSENMQNSVLRLNEIVKDQGYEDLDDYVMKQLGFTSQSDFNDGFMSLQVEAIAAAIYQMQERHRSVIIADQTGVGKGRQAGALIRWAIRQGKTPVFVTENDSLYTDMYYDMADSYIDDVVPFITNTGVGIKSRDIDEDEAAEIEHSGGKVPMLHKLPNKQTTDAVKTMAKNGLMPSGANAVFTTYDQMNTAGPRREALLKLAEKNDVVLILDESHKAAKFDPKKGRVNRNEYFTSLIKASWGTTYLSATFAKNPDNLAFYFNTDLADAMDGMKQLVEILTAGGVRLQEVMSRALTRNGQLFRREISYEGIEIKTHFDDKNADRDRDFINKVTSIVQDLIPVNNQIYNDLVNQYGEDPQGLAALLWQRKEISETEYQRVLDGVRDGKKIRINFTRITDQIHNLVDQMLVASKADLAVDQILADIQAGRKPVIGLDKTNMAMLNEFITRTEKVVGDDVSDLNWASLMDFWGNKSFNVSISVGEVVKESERIRGNVGRAADGIDTDSINALDRISAQAEKQLSDLNLPLSPVDYIAQKAMERAQKELGKEINVKEITGRYNGDYGIDYSEGKIRLFKVARFTKREIIDRFNGEMKDADNNKLESDVDAIILNQSGSTGVSLHSSVKHGDRRERHMTIIEPAGDINVFQQMLGRIFRTGMGDTVPHYTVLASAIPTDARKINVLRKKMESLNAQTSSNREGAAGVQVEDIMNPYGDAVVKDWVEQNEDFKELFPQWEGKIAHDRGLAYWVTGKIALFSFEFQEMFYEQVGQMYTEAVEQAKADGTFTLEEKFYEWNAEYLEEIVIAEPRKDGTGFNSGAWLVKLKADSNFRAMTPDEVAAKVDENSDADLTPDPKKVEDITNFHMQVKEETLKSIEGLAPAEEHAEDPILKRTYERYRDTYKAIYEIALHELLGEDGHPKPNAFRRPTTARFSASRESLDEMRVRIRETLPSGTKIKFDDLTRTMDRAINTAIQKVEQEEAVSSYELGKTFNFTIGEGDNRFSTTGTIIGFNRLNKSTNPYVPGDIEIEIAMNKPGGTDDNGVMKRTLGQVSKWDVNPVREHMWGDDNRADIYKKYHETLAETSKTTEEWVAIGNPLIAASEIIPAGEYMQFSDKYGRRMFGIKMPKKAVEAGVEAMIQGNLEIPSQDGGKIITEFISENPHSRLAREFGFRTRGSNVIITFDRETGAGIRIKFDRETATEKVNDPTLQEMLDKIGSQVLEFDEEWVVTVPFEEARPIVNQILRRSRLVVPGSMKGELRNYMNITGSTKAGENVVNVVVPQDVKKYVFEYQGEKVIAHRGSYQTKAGRTYDGFYMQGLPRFFNLKNIARMTLMKGRPGEEHEGRPFLPMEEFTRGRVIHGHEGKAGLGKPVLNESVKTDGTSFKIDLNPNRRVSAEQAETILDAMPKRLKRLVKVVEGEHQLPAPVKAKIEQRGLSGRVNGVYHEGRIYLVADKLSSPEQAAMVFLHEAIGHLGLRKLMGDDLKAFLDEVGNAFPEKMQELAERYNANLKNDAQWYEIAEEVVAHMAELDVRPSLMNRLMKILRDLVRKLGFNLTLNENDVFAILRAASKSLDNGGIDAGGEIAQPGIRFSIKQNTADNDAQRHEDTVRDAILDGQPVDAIFRAVWGVAEATGIPKLTRFTSAQTLRGAVNFYDKYMPWAHSTVQHIAKGLIDQYGLDDEYKQLKASMSSMKAGIIDEVRDIIATMQEMEVSDEDAKKIHEILTNEIPREDSWDAVTEPIRKRIEELGQKAVDLNLISQESYDANKGMYLHRVYQKYEMNRSGLEKFADQISGARKPKIKGDETKERGLSYFVPMSRIIEDTGLTADELIVDGEGATIYKISQMSANGQKAIKVYYSLKPLETPGDGFRSEEMKVRAKNAGRVKLWRDWTKQEREDMGQITDARYVLGKTYGLLAHDLSTGEFFKQISENEAWTLPKDQEGDVDVISGEQALRFGVVGGAEWVRVPDTKISKSQARVYGALAGRVVRAEIFQDLNQLNKMQQNSVWKSIMTAFKLNKTARNPVVHFNNIMSNLVLMDMADVRFSDLYRALQEMRNKGSLYDEAKRNGAFGVSYAEKELQNEVLDKLLDEIHEATGAKPVGLEDVFLSMDRLPLNKQFAFMMKMLDGLWHGVDIKGKKVGLKQIDKKMLNYYQHEDEVFRMATYIRRRMQGMSETEAGLSARDQFLNYDINAPWINAARATVLPFISYSYRAIPIVAKSIAQRPWKLAKYFTLAYGMNAIGYALSGGDEDKERKSLRDEVSGKLWIGSERMVRMWWNDPQGNPYFWDVRRLVPVGDVFDTNQYHAALPIIPASVMPSGPIAMGFEFMLNKTGFFGEEIVDPLADDWVLGTQKTLDWMWKSYGPSAPWIPYSYYWDKIKIAATGGRDRLGRDYELLPALASSFGVKIQPHDVDYGIALKAMEIERSVEAIRNQLNFLEKDYWQGKVNKSSYEATRERYTMKLERLDQKARELVGRD